ncbi:hypothetical protein BY996DRAFT_8527276 [Phakopsora pachyrhizi]|nr:hypothetical protein BY996DRAFT_8527276 [Phakopsora pachyrhizi]
MHIKVWVLVKSRQKGIRVVAKIDLNLHQALMGARLTQDQSNHESHPHTILIQQWWDETLPRLPESTTAVGTTTGSGELSGSEYFNNNQSTSSNLACSSSLLTWNQGGFETGAVGNHHPFNFITPDQWNHYLHENSIKCQSLIQPHQFLSLSSSKLTSGMIYNHHHHLQKQHEIPQQQKQSFCQPETIVLSTSSPEHKETIDERDELLKKKEKNSSLTPEMREKIELKKRQAQEIKAQRIQAALEAERIQNEKKVVAGERCLREFGITSGPTREKFERFNGRTGSSDEVKVATEEKDFISLDDQRDKHLMLESVQWEGEWDESGKNKPYMTDPRCSEDQLKS